MSFKNNLVMGTIIGGASALIGYGLATIGFKKKRGKTNSKNRRFGNRKKRCCKLQRT